MPNSESKTTLFAVINPVAGSCDSEKIQSVLREHLGERLLGVHLTSKDDDFAEIVQKAVDLKADVVLAAGGDGTISQVATHLIGKTPSLLIMPAGTANLLAKSLQVPHDIHQVIKTLENGVERSLDAIKVDEKYFFSHVSVGMYSKIAEQTVPEAKRRIGRFAYIWSGLKLLSDEKRWKFRLNMDGRSLKVKASTLMVANVGEMGAADIQWGPSVSPSDGTLDLCLIRSRSWKDYLKLAGEFFYYRDHSPSQSTHYQFQKQLSVKSSTPLPVRGDGELIGETPLTLSLSEKALRVKVPNAEARAQH